MVVIVFDSGYLALDTMTEGLSGSVSSGIYFLGAPFAHMTMKLLSYGGVGCHDSQFFSDGRGHTKWLDMACIAT